MLFCIDCNHYKQITYVDTCCAPELGISLVTGCQKTQMAAYCRSENSLCRADARYFSPKQVEPEPEPVKPTPVTPTVGVYQRIITKLQNRKH